jgi:hypothetical protein
MRDHADAVEFFRVRGFAAERRVWALGDTVVITTVSQESHGDILADRFVEWLVPRGEAGWDLVHTVLAHERRLRFNSLERACGAALQLLPLHEPHDRCPACCGRRRLNFGERLAPAPRRWYTSTRCTTCGARSEADGDGELPDDLRAMEVARNGLWSVVVTTEPKPLAWRTVRAAIGLDMTEVSALRRRIPGVVFEGTFAQAFRVREAFVEAAASAELTEIGSADV